MVGYKLTQEQADFIRVAQFRPNCFFNPIEDINGDYFIFDGEVKGCVNEDFMWVKELPQAEYVLPPKTV